MPFSNVINDFHMFRAEMSSKRRTEQLVFLFWLAGPFILLIERTPADIWLTVLGWFFLVRQASIRDFRFLSVFWVRAAIVFWSICLISALLSDSPGRSFSEAFSWIRFPLFAMATAFWLAECRSIRKVMIYSTGAGLFLMCVILSAEIFFEGQKGGRLTWPYGDLVPGGYVAKVGLPAFLVLISASVSMKGKTALFAALFSLFSIVISVLTGERINFIIRACSGMVAALWTKGFMYRKLLLVIVEVAAIVGVLVLMPNLAHRMTSKFVEQLPVTKSSPYFQTMYPAILAFESEKVFGIGPDNFNVKCFDLIGTSNPEGFQCHPHPHNHYLQALAETGIVGFISFCVFSLSVLIFAYQKKDANDSFDRLKFIIPLALFWPITTTGDLFGQFHNIFGWYAIALSLSGSKP